MLTPWDQEGIGIWFPITVLITVVSIIIVIIVYFLMDKTDNQK